jgi:peptidoglycan/LPS O-acetylase OafA/YrhL
MVERMAISKLSWENGAAGVDIFFAISGFVISSSADSSRRSETPARLFLRRRAERIAPLYWILTSAKLIAIWMVPPGAIRDAGGAWHVLASYLFIPSQYGTLGPFPVLIPGWTLNFEALFYCLFAVALTFPRQRMSFLVCTLSLIALAGVLFPGQAGILSWLNPIVVEFLFGILLYRLWQLKVRTPAWLCVAFVVGGTALIAGIPWGAAQPLLRPIVWGIPGAAIVWGLLGLEGWLNAKLGRIAAALGDASYSIYLTHGFVLPVVATLLVRLNMHHIQNPIAVGLILLLSGIAGGLLVYHLIERPFIERFRRLRRSAMATSA